MSSADDRIQQMLDISSEADTPTITVAPDTWIRNRRRTTRSAAFALVFSALMLWISIGGFAGEFAHKSQNGGIVVIPIAIAAAIFGVRQFRSGLRIGSGVVTIRGPVRTYVLAASDVSSFEPESRGKTPPQPWAHRADGRAIPVGSLSVGRAKSDQTAANVAALQPLCDKLNDLLKAAQAIPVSTDFGQVDGVKLSRNVDQRDLTAWTIGAVIYTVAVLVAAIIIVAAHPKPLVIIPAVLFVGSGTAWSLLLITSVKRSMKKDHRKTTT
jgi:hypothetical protein